MEQKDNKTYHSTKKLFLIVSITILISVKTSVRYQGQASARIERMASDPYRESHFKKWIVHPRRFNFCRKIFHHKFSGAARGWAGLALAHPEFWSSVNPIPIWGADCAHHITDCPPGFENLTASLQVHISQWERMIQKNWYLWKYYFVTIGLTGENLVVKYFSKWVFLHLQDLIQDCAV